MPPPRFTKNLSPDKINLSTLKGEGQLSNLELDEEVLQNMLDLPTWLAVTRVYCNKAAIRVGECCHSKHQSQGVQILRSKLLVCETL